MIMIDTIPLHDSYQMGHGMDQCSLIIAKIRS